MSWTRQDVQRVFNELYFIVALIFVCIITNHLYDQKVLLKGKLGQRIILQSDTLMIMDYSTFHNNFILSNGQYISFDLAVRTRVLKEIK